MQSELLLITEIHIKTNLSSLTKWLTRELTIWLSVDALHETLTLS